MVIAQLKRVLILTLLISPTLFTNIEAQTGAGGRLGIGRFGERRSHLLLGLDGRLTLFEREHSVNLITNVEIGIYRVKHYRDGKQTEIDLLVDMGPEIGLPKVNILRPAISMGFTLGSTHFTVGDAEYKRDPKILAGLYLNSKAVMKMGPFFRRTDLRYRYLFEDGPDQLQIWTAILSIGFGGTIQVENSLRIKGWGRAHAPDFPHSWETTFFLRLGLNIADQSG